MPEGAGSVPAWLRASHPVILSGDVAVVTGAGAGLGQAIARGLAAAGAAVFCADIDGTAAQTTADAITASGKLARAAACDVTDTAACASVARLAEEAFGRVTILVNCAGVARPVALDAENFDARYEETMSVNVKGSLNMVRALLGQLRNGGGSILNMASLAAFVAGSASVPYGTSKGAVRQMTQFLARDFAPYGVRVNALAPGVMETPMTAAVRADPIRTGKTLARTLLGRFGRADEVVGPALFLCSPMASYVTGVILSVDGGYVAN